MTISYRTPGVYVEERVLPSIAAAGQRAAVATFLGDLNRGPVEPVRVESWPRFQALFGGLGTGERDLPYAVYSYFANGGRVCWIRRVAPDDAETATVNLTANAVPALDVDAASPGAWGNDISVSVTPAGDLFTLSVFYGTSSTPVERWTSLSMDPSSSRFVENLINSDVAGSNYIRAYSTALASGTVDWDEAQDNLDPVVSPVALTGGLDGSALIDADLTGALDSLDAIEGPFLLNIPGVTSATVVNAAIAYAEARTDVFVIVDSRAADNPGAAIALAASYTTSSYVAVYYPRIYMADPLVGSLGATRLTAPGGALAGQYVTTDTLRGVFKAPAGQNVRLSGAVSLETKPTAAQWESLTDAHVNSFKVMPGGGISVWGARTQKRGAIDMYVPARRSLIYLSGRLKDVTNFAVFEPNDERLWQLVTNQCQSVLNEFWVAGGLAGATAEQAYFVVCDDSNNTQQTVAAGELNVDVGVAIQAPAEFVIIRIGQWDGGASVVEIFNPAA